MLEELIIRSLCDTLPQAPADAVFLFGQTEDNQQSVFASAIYLLSNKLANKVMFLDTVPLSGYPGFEVWQKELEKLGVKPDEIEPVPVTPGTSSLNTRIEAQNAIKHARKIGYESIIATAPPFQQPRAFMTAVTAAQEHHSKLKVYSYPGRNLSWCEKVVHSQGKVTGTRAQLITGEIERIHKYGNIGDLAKVEEVLDYLNRRDAGKC